jgi:hypothetical protein
MHKATRQMSDRHRSTKAQKVRYELTCAVWTGPSWGRHVEVWGCNNTDLAADNLESIQAHMDFHPMQSAGRLWYVKHDNWREEFRNGLLRLPNCVPHTR